MPPPRNISQQNALTHQEKNDAVQVWLPSIFDDEKIWQATDSTVPITNGSIGSFSKDDSSVSRSSVQATTGQCMSMGVNNENSAPIALRDMDFPVGRGLRSSKHPKRIQFRLLIKRDAPEYNVSPQDEGFHSKEHGRFIRSRARIIRSVVNELMPAENGGRYMSKNRNGMWEIRPEYHIDSQKMRNVISGAFNAEIRSWGGMVPPLLPVEDIKSIASSEFSALNTEQSQTSSRFVQDIIGEEQGAQDEQDDDRDGMHYRESTCSEINDKRSHVSGSSSPSAQHVRRRRRLAPRNIQRQASRVHDEDDSVQQELCAMASASPAEIDNDYSCYPGSTLFSLTQPPQDRRILVVAGTNMISNALGSVTLVAERSTISSLTESDCARKQQGWAKLISRRSLPQALKKLVAKNPAVELANEPLKSDGEGIVQLSATITDMEIALVEGVEESTLGSVGYGRVSRKSVGRLVSDLKKRKTLRVSAIKDRLDELTHRAISEDE